MLRAPKHRLHKPPRALVVKPYPTGRKLEGGFSRDTKDQKAILPWLLPPPGSQSPLFLPRLTSSQPGPPALRGKPGLHRWSSKKKHSNQNERRMEEARGYLGRWEPCYQQPLRELKEILHPLNKNKARTNAGVLLELKTFQQKSDRFSEKDYEDKVETLPESKAVRPKAQTKQEKEIRKLEES